LTFFSDHSGLVWAMPTAPNAESKTSSIILISPDLVAHYSSDGGSYNPPWPVRHVPGRRQPFVAASQIPPSPLQLLLFAGGPYSLPLRAWLAQPPHFRQPSASGFVHKLPTLLYTRLKRRRIPIEVYSWQRSLCSLIKKHHLIDYQMTIWRLSGRYMASPGLMPKVL